MCHVTTHDQEPHVRINYSGCYHYTRTGIVVTTTKINSNIKEAKVQEVQSLNPIKVVKPKSGYPTKVVIHQ